MVMNANAHKHEPNARRLGGGVAINANAKDRVKDRAKDGQE
jgi:hypothetical protein